VTKRRLRSDARGITTAEYLVLFVVIAVATLGAWIAFGSDLASVFVGGDAAGTQASSSSGTRAGTASASQPSAAAGAAEPSWAAAAWSGIKSAAGEAVSLLPGAAEHAVDAAEGYVAGLNPITGLLPTQPQPTFGHQGSFGAGMVLGSAHGLGVDAYHMGSGAAGVATGVAAIAATDGAALPIAGPGVVAAAGQALAGAAAAGGHLGNMGTGIAAVSGGDGAPSSGGGKKKPPPPKRRPGEPGGPGEPGDGAGPPGAPGDNVSASTPVGRRGSPMNVPGGTNTPSTIGGRKYTGHALDQMQGRGVTPTAVENAVQHGARSPGNRAGTTEHVYDNVRVITNTGGDVITVIPR
jgi:Flp pilus assembly pilin Flp